MKSLLCVPVIVMALVASSTVHADETMSRQVAQAPVETTGQAVAPCLTRDLKTLSWQSDVSSFMDASCPPEMRTQALRKLWRTMPPPSEPNSTEF
jgi:hypothetical protein